MNCHVHLDYTEAHSRLLPQQRTKEPYHYKSLLERDGKSQLKVMAFLVYSTKIKDISKKLGNFFFLVIKVIPRDLCFPINQPRINSYITNRK